MMALSNTHNSLFICLFGTLLTSYVSLILLRCPSCLGPQGFKRGRYGWWHLSDLWPQQREPSSLVLWDSGSSCHHCHHEAPFQVGWSCGVVRHFIICNWGFWHYLWGKKVFYILYWLCKIEFLLNVSLFLINVSRKLSEEAALKRKRNGNTILLVKIGNYQEIIPYPQHVLISFSQSSG